MANEVRASSKNLWINAGNSERGLLEKKLRAEKLDVTIPGKPSPWARGILSPWRWTRPRYYSWEWVFESRRGPEIEAGEYNFTKRNPGRPTARDRQDTFYLDEVTLLLRIQTSHVRVRVMGAACPSGSYPQGASYRKDGWTPASPCVTARRPGVDRGITMGF